MKLLKNKRGFCFTPLTFFRIVLFPLAFRWTKHGFSSCLFRLLQQTDVHETIFFFLKMRSDMEGKRVQLVLVRLFLSANSCLILMSLQGWRLALNPLIYFDFLWNLRSPLKVMFSLLNDTHWFKCEESWSLGYRAPGEWKRTSSFRELSPPKHTRHKKVKRVCG